jgi:hypothetical protein
MQARLGRQAVTSRHAGRIDKVGRLSWLRWTMQARLGLAANDRQSRLRRKI